MRREIKLSELDIKELRLRKAITGAMLFEISGQDAGSKASRLAERMAATLKDLPAKITVPRRTAELRVTGLEDSVTSEEVAAAVAEAGGCHADEVSVEPIRYAGYPYPYGSVWLRCSLTTARKINRRGDAWSGGKINIGWSTARASPLPARQLQCFRCMESGHVRRDCKSVVDRSERCYQCGAEGHRARDRSARVSDRCARTWDCPRHITWGRRYANRRPVRRAPHRRQGPFQAMLGTRQRERKRRRRLLVPGRPEKRMEKSDAPNARGTARRRLWKRSLSWHEQKKRTRTTAPAVQS